MTSEETPLLATCNGSMPDDTIYNRFTPGQKRWIVFVVSAAGLLPSKLSRQSVRAMLINGDGQCLFKPHSSLLSLR